MSGEMQLLPRVRELVHVVGGPILGIDTSSMIASLCVAGLRGDEVDELTLPASAQGSEQIGPALAAALGARPHLAAVVVGLGPGSFTGLRVGLAMAKGLALGGDVPLYGVSSLAATALMHGPGRVATTVEARRGEIYAALYDVGVDGSVQVITAPHVTTREVFAPRSAGAVLVHDAPVRASACVVVAAERLRRAQADDVAAIVPTYLEGSAAERPRE